MTKYFWIQILLAPALLLLVGCSSVFYYPSPSLYVNPAKLPIPPQEVDIEARDGHLIPAWLFETKTKPQKGIIVQFHGNAQNLSAHFMFLASAPLNGYDHLIFDYRGYGRSQGSPNPKNTVSDGMDVLLWVKKKYPDLPLIVFAQSLGGAIALKSLVELKDQLRADALVVDSSFVSYRSAAKSVLSSNKLTWLLQPIGWLIVDNSMAPDGLLSELNPLPTLVIHGTHDHVISYSSGKELYKQAPSPKTFWKITEGRHTDFMGRKNYREQLYGFLSGLFR